ncbi:MAG TPA: YicC/YloC family endoribonuclease [Opitutaceae bacterium]|jgi:uncharacterized protein (TIGR00255 family)
MTGYGRASAALAGGELSVQVSSVNRRSLDLSIKMPGDWESLEAEVGLRVRSVAIRGKVSVEVEFNSTEGAPDGANEAAVGAALDRLSALADARRIPFEPTAELLWQIISSQRSGATFPPAEKARPVLLGILDRALADFAAMRSKEGAALGADFGERISLCRRHLEAIRERAPAVAPTYRTQLFKRLRDAGLELDLNDERVLREIALFADRCDVTEEMVRFRSHLDQLEALLKGGDEIGRKADFILQELGREANTMGSKANDLAISKNVIELKNELERVREQMANVE